MDGVTWADKGEASDFLGLGTGAGTSCSEHPASSRGDGKVLHVPSEWSPDRQSIDKTFTTDALPDPLDSTETRNHVTCSDRSQAHWSSQAETRGHCRFRENSPCPGLHVATPKLCVEQWVASKGWVHPARVPCVVSSSQVRTNLGHKNPLLTPSQAACKLRKCFVLNTCLNPSGLVLSRHLKMCWEVLAVLLSTWLGRRCWKLHDCIHTGVLKCVN